MAEHDGTTDMLKFETLVEAIHYVCSKAANNPEQLDQIKLNKVLWYSDAQSYMKTGISITGTTYLRKPFGPVARANRPAVEKLERDGVLHRGKASGSGHWNTHFDVIEPFAGPTNLSESDIGIIDDVYESVVAGHTSMGVSERTHGEIWQLADEDESLPLYTVFAERLGEVTDEHMALAQEGL